MQNSKSEQPERRIAILLESLDDGTAELLLKQFPREQRERIELEWMQLGEVDPDEAAIVVREFMSDRRQLLQQIAMDDPLAPVTSVAQRITSTGHSELSAAIREISAKKLYELIRDEYPQTIAFVIAQMSPQQPPSLPRCCRRLIEATYFDGLVKLKS